MKYFSYTVKRAYLACFTCNMSVVNVCIYIYIYTQSYADRHTKCGAQGLYYTSIYVHIYIYTI